MFVGLLVVLVLGLAVYRNTRKMEANVHTYLIGPGADAAMPLDFIEYTLNGHTIHVPTGDKVSDSAIADALELLDGDEPDENKFKEESWITERTCATIRVVVFRKPGEDEDGNCARLDARVAEIQSRPGLEPKTP